ncbi:MAG TPA: hypothetical protein PLH94_07130 [Fimbriimonadaceae bacterium]|nr:hypothetical protein [Fimbriimonadaceae bacterium]
MSAIELLINMTDSAVDMLFSSARKMPAERQVWSPMETGRTALDQLQECACAPDLHMQLIDPEHPGPFEGYEGAREYRKRWTTVEACEAACRESTARWAHFVRGLSPERLASMAETPWGPTPVGVITGFHYWNLVYHLGQINYIQTLYGDRDMF